MYFNVIAATESFRRISADIEKGLTPVSVVGLSGVHKAAIAAALTERGPLLFLAPDEAAATRLCEDLATFAPQSGAAVYPVRDFALREVESASHEYEHVRLGVLQRVLSGECRAVVASIEAALQYTLPPAMLSHNTFVIEAGGQYQLDDLTAKLSAAGYERRDQVDGICQFSVRGGILDLYSPGVGYPVRVEFWGDEADTVSAFDLDTQRRIDTVKRVRVSPAREVLYPNTAWLVKRIRAAAERLRGKQGVKAKAHLEADIERLEGGLTLRDLDKYLPLIYSEPATLFDYLGGCPVLVSELISAKDSLKSVASQQNADLELLYEEGILFPGCDKYSLDFTDAVRLLSQSDTVLFDSFSRSIPDLKLADLVDVQSLSPSAWSGELKFLYEDLHTYMDRGYCCAVLAGTDKAADALMRDLADQRLNAVRTPDVPEVTPGLIYVLSGTLSAGLELPDSRFALITQSAAGAAKPRHRARPKKAGEQIRSLSDLNVGDYIVHAAHGIGVFEGIVKRDIHGVVKDYIKIRYAGTDALFVPVTQLDLVSKYIGPKEDSAVKLSRLNSVEWQNTRKRVKAAVKSMAKELIALYAARMNAKGHAFSADTEWQRDFEARFPYDETDDQLRCISEIKADMEAPRPMDRLLCGDVGFGKTEVALRAAFKCVMDAKQCAVLVPTTILAWQHFRTFTERMQGFPVTVELLSRFRTPKQQAETLKKLRRGEVDIVIGTHRLLQKDVVFKDLGLCIIDEEQRFGVAHKERFKELRNNLDVLTLSATPIPRTLNMAMSGIRDMSTIDESPQDRFPVQTYVLEHDYGVIAEAIHRELRRGGQVFYLHNRVESISSCAARIQTLVPEARIVTAHGKMSEEELSEVWRQLLDHEVDILVCTTIIETGVDVPNCNTLIIEDADRFGLSQLYQLRGRVGRSNRRAFAYFTFRRGKAVSEIAAKRLAAIREFTAFGSGFRIAMRDLEIRGAGSILGANQHGHMEAVGYEMYLKLLSEAVEEERGEAPAVSGEECLIDIRIGAHIPEEYIDNLTQRLDIYKKIALIQSEEDALDITDELIDRFGEPPAAVKGLIDVALLRNIASKHDIYEISQKNDLLTFYVQKVDLKALSALSAMYRGRFTLNAGAKPYFCVQLTLRDEPVNTIRAVLYALDRTVPQEN